MSIFTSPLLSTPEKNLPPAASIFLCAVLGLTACDSGASSTTVAGQGQGLSRIGDFVWHDKDRDGIQDPTEPGVPDVRLVLKAGPGLFRFTRTDAQGRYVFDELPAGTYQVGIDASSLPALALHSPCNVGTDDALDSDCSAIVVLPDGQTDDLTVDFGLFADIVKIDFETEDDFLTPLFNGQDITPAGEFGIMLTFDGFPNSGAEAAIFDSDPAGPNASSSDPDLLVGTGNVLILQENLQQSSAGFYGRPDDDANGGHVDVVFEGSGASIRSLDLIDIDPGPSQNAQVKLTDLNGRIRDYFVPSGWTEDVSVHGAPGFRTLDLTTTALQPGFQANATAQSDPLFDPNCVTRLRVQFFGSGALDNLIFAPNLVDGISP